MFAEPTCAQTGAATRQFTATASASLDVLNVMIRVACLFFNIPAF
jgi:hypothetical protein